MPLCGQPRPSVPEPKYDCKYVQYLKKAVIKTLKSLQDSQIVVVEKRFNGNARTPNLYTICDPPLLEKVTVYEKTRVVLMGNKGLYTM